MLKLKTIAFLILTVFCTAGFSDEGEPIRLFQIDFDLSADNAVELISARFDCSTASDWYSEKKSCSVNSTEMAEIFSSGKNLAGVKFTCASFNGCGYSREELIESLSEQKELVFEEYCATGTLGDQVCVYGNYSSVYIWMERSKFRAKNLSFD